MFRRWLRGRCTVIRLSTSIIGWPACQLETPPSTLPFGTEWGANHFQKAYCKLLYENACLLWRLTLFDIERVFCQKICSSSSSSPYLVYPSPSPSCQFVILGNKGAVALPRAAIIWALFSLRLQWRQWQLLRRIDRRSADNRCSVFFSLFVIGFFMCGCCLPVNYRSLVPYGCFGAPACISMPFYYDEFVYDIDLRTMYWWPQVIQARLLSIRGKSLECRRSSNIDHRKSMEDNVQ